MADQADSTTDTTPDETQSDSEQTLGDGGKKALDAERRRANAADKALKALQLKLDEIEAEKLSKEDRAAKERDQAILDRDQARAEALRFRVASKFQISDEDADLFLTGSDEETLTRQAQRLAERIKSSEGLYVPAEGHHPGAPALNSDALETSLRQKLNIQT